MADRPMHSWRARAAVSEAIDVFHSPQMQDVWNKALERRERDPESAVTLARTLLESLCKHILDEAGVKYWDGLPLPKLYKLVEEQLDLAPTEPTAKIFTKLFEGCADIVEAVGALRNHLSDAHGRGPFGTMPDWRHAELAVMLSGAMTTYLAAVWKGRQPTVSETIKKFIDNPPKALGDSRRRSLDVIARESLGEVLAAKVEVSDLIAYCEQKRSEGMQPSTILQYMS